MQIEKFTPADIPNAACLTLDAWSEALTEWPGDVARVVCEYSVRDEFLNPELALKITDNGEMKGFIFAALATDTNEADEWIAQERRRFTRESDNEIFDMVIEASNRNEQMVRDNMSDGDVMLTFFLSRKKGCGRLLLDAMTSMLAAKGYKNCLLWTDRTCNHQYYPKNGFSLVVQKDFDFVLDEEPFTVFVYKKGLR